MVVMANIMIYGDNASVANIAHLRRMVRYFKL